MLKKVVDDFKALYKKELGVEFPDDVHEQMSQAIEAVFASWFGKRAVDYRNSQKIAHDLGTGVNVQTMVFGNMGNDSGTGVAFTRNPATGEKVLYGEYLINAQGEDVVAGIRTPKKIAQMQDRNARSVRAVPARSPISSRSTIATCRTWNSPSSAASCGCCRPAPASARRRPP